MQLNEVAPAEASLGILSSLIWLFYGLKYRKSVQLLKI